MGSPCPGTDCYAGENISTSHRAACNSKSHENFVGILIMMGILQSGPVAYKALYDQGISCCGTVRTNRIGFPEMLKKGKGEKVPKGYYEYLSCGPLLAAVWFDRRFVYFVSTLHKIMLRMTQ